jgi:Divergent InlB B-repeat domain
MKIHGPAMSCKAKKPETTCEAGSSLSPAIRPANGMWQTESGRPAGPFRRTLAPIALLVVLLMTSSSLINSSRSSSGTNPAAIPPGDTQPAARPGVASPISTAPAIRPSASSFSPFYNSTPLNAGIFPGICSGFCAQQAQSPSVMTLTNGHIGVGFSVVTNQTISTCANAPGNSTIQIGYATSSDGGRSFTNPRLIGDGGASACPYNQFFEPSFAAGSAGRVYGAYVEANATFSQMFQTYGQVIYPYAYRTATALAFVNSTDNGTTFTTGQVLVAGVNISRPAVAAFGRSVYIVYQNDTNVSGAIPGGHMPIRQYFLYSTNAGSTWHGPYAIPTKASWDPAELNTTLSPSIAVNASGSIAVVFAENRTCEAWCIGSRGAAYAYDIVAIHSSTNGTTWTGPVVIARGAGEAPGNGAYALFQETPATAVAFGPTSGTVYVAYSASTNLSLVDPPWSPFLPAMDYSRPTMFASASTDNAATWSTPVPLAAPLRSVDDFQQLFGEANFNPGIGVSPAGKVYVEWTYFSWTNGACGFTAFSANSYAQSTEEYVATSFDGIGWSTPSLVNVSVPSAGIDYLNYLGYQGSIAFTPGGQPVLAYAMPLTFLQYNFTSAQNWDITAVEISVPFVGATTNVTFIENGLAPGTAWTATIQGVGLNTTASQFTVTGVPKGRPVYIQWPYGFPRPGDFSPFVAPVVSDAPLVQGGPAAVFNAPSTVYFNFTTFYPLGLHLMPAEVPSLNLFWQNQGPNASFQYTGSYYTFIFGTTVYTGSSGCPVPWFFPKGMTLHIGSVVGGMNLGLSGSTPIGYWTGNGPGNYTGSGPYANLTIGGPINETLWMSGAGTYSELVRAPTLPSTSRFNVTIDGVPYSGQGQANLSAPSLGTGPHLLTNITANSSRAGWKYFGRADTGARFILPEQPVVNLTFALVDAAAAAGTVAFHAPQLPNGTVWHLNVNGTEYSSSTPWINLTTRPGNFSVDAYPIVDASANSTLAPVAPSATLSLSPGRTYDINFTAAYRVDVSGSVGGTVAVQGASQAFYIPGSRVTFNATALPGYSWAGWTGHGVGAYSGPNRSATITVQGPVVEVAAFVPLALDRFNLTVQETGVPNGTEWSVDLNGVGYSSNSSTLVIGNLYSFANSGNLGRYTLRVPYAYDNGTAPGTRYVPTSYSTTALGGGSASIQFVPQYFLQVQATTGALSVSPSGWQTAGAVVALSAIAADGFVFDRWVGTGPGNYSGPMVNPTISLTGPLTETAVFQPVTPTPPPRYSVAFHLASTLDPGTVWTIQFNGTNVTSVGPDLVVSGLLAGTYSVNEFSALAPSGLTLYDPTAPTSQIDLTANRTIATSFSTLYYVSVAAVGPGTASPTSGWRAAGLTIALSATPTGANIFLGWSSTGAGSYSGLSAQWNLKVTNPIQEIASFGPAAPAATKTTSSTNSLWSDPYLWVALAVVGLAAGLAIGYLLVRRRGGGTSAPAYSESDGGDPSSTEAGSSEGET